MFQEELLWHINSVNDDTYKLQTEEVDLCISRSFTHPKKYFNIFDPNIMSTFSAY